MKEDKMDGACDTQGEEKYNLYVVIPEGKSIFGRARRRWDNDIKIRLKELRWKASDWINLAEDCDK